MNLLPATDDVMGAVFAMTINCADNDVQDYRIRWGFAWISDPKILIIMDVPIMGLPIKPVKAEFRKFNSMDKGIIDLIPAAVEAVKQECQTKMELFSSCGHAADGLAACAGKKTDACTGKMDQEMLVKLIAQEVQKQLRKA